MKNKQRFIAQVFDKQYFVGATMSHYVGRECKIVENYDFPNGTIVIFDDGNTFFWDINALKPI